MNPFIQTATIAVAAAVIGLSAYRVGYHEGASQQFLPSYIEAAHCPVTNQPENEK